MRISGVGTFNTNELFSDANVFRGSDFVVNQNGVFTISTYLGATSGEYGHIQLFNPVGSGVILLLDALQITPQSSANFYLAPYNTELTTDGGAGVSVKLSGSAGKGHIRKQTNAAALGTELRQWKQGASDGHLIDLLKPFEMAEGEGLNLICITQNLVIRGGFLWREV